MKSTPPMRFAARAALLTAALMAVVATPNAADAQCAAPDTTDAIDAAQTVFVGRVHSTDELGRIAQMDVLSIWKGRDLNSRVEVRGANSADSAPLTTDRRFEVGATYLVVPENGRQPFLATSCSATQRYTNPPNLIPTTYQDAAGSTAGRAALASNITSAEDQEAAVTSSIVPLLGAIGLIALAWAAIVWFRSHQPERLAEAVAVATPTAPQPKPRRVRRRNFKKDTAGAHKATQRTLRRNNRGFRVYRKRQERQVASARKARGSTDTS